MTVEQFATLYDVNVLGTQRVSRTAEPRLREQDSVLLNADRQLQHPRRPAVVPGPVHEATALVTAVNEWL
ncbi:hypothetical protein [Streptomyces lanatus]|uniref:Uncharacterized protein n=1 Tax=Streptomyces lanatus TaxID=66900 RepID=A0ABV1Y236_9ACTN|nr:hypothetical protein [Streptomyces lanatus]GHH25646.1 hypothetical protein GCM10018780_77860 [Streptomyces lanatus]